MAFCMQVKEMVYPLVDALLKKVTGATRMLIFQHYPEWALWVSLALYPPSLPVDSTIPTLFLARIPKI